MPRSLLLQQKQMLLLQKLLFQNRRQLQLPLFRSLQLLRQIFLQLQNRKSRLPLQRENGKARAASSLRENVLKVRARAAGKARVAAGKASPVVSSLRENAPKGKARAAAGKVSLAVVGKASLVDSSLRESVPKVMARAAAGKARTEVSNPGENGRARVAALSHGQKARAVSDRVRKVRAEASDQGAKATRCHRR